MQIIKNNTQPFGTCRIKKQNQLIFFPVIQGGNTETILNRNNNLLLRAEMPVMALFRRFKDTYASGGMCYKEIPLSNDIPYLKLYSRCVRFVFSLLNSNGGNWYFRPLITLNVCLKYITSPTPYPCFYSIYYKKDYEVHNHRTR